MISDIKFAIYNILTSKGIYAPEIVNMITEYDITEFYYTSRFEGEEKQIQRWVCKKGKHSEIKTWHRNGVLQSWCTLYDKRVDGFLLEWDESGIMSKRFYYIEGGLRRDMINTIWYENGELAALKEPKLHITWLPNGKLSSYIELNDEGKKHGFCVNIEYNLQKHPTIKYYENGKEIFNNNIKWKDGLIISDFKSFVIDTNKYHTNIKKENGKTIEQQYYKNDKKHGKSLSYHYDGSLASVTWYSNGLKHGSYRTWYPSYGTSLEIRGAYYKDKKDGDWFIYTRYGVVKDIIRYNKGVKQNHKFFNDAGDLFKDECIETKCQ